MKLTRARVPYFFVILICLACASAMLAPGRARAAEQRPLPGLHALTSPSSQPTLARALRVQAEGTWVQEPGDNWWFWYASGGWAANSWEWIGNAWYWFNADGWMQRGWQLVHGNWFHLNMSGAMDTFWYLEGSTWYYLGPDGWMRRDWAFDNGTWYYLRPSGIMATGWLEKDGKTYYLGDSGVMATGWTWANNAWYYFHEDGSMARSEATPDGQAVGADGRWTPEAPQTPTTPASPEQPTTSDTPTTPETAQTPVTPETPSTPATADTPVSPATPLTPATPATADTPDTTQSPESATTPESPALPVVPAHTVTTNDAKLLYTRAYAPDTQAEQNTDGSYKVINGKKIIVTLDELEEWGDDVVIHYTGDTPRLALVYIPAWDDDMHSDFTAVTNYSELSDGAYGWYAWTTVTQDDATSTTGEAHFPVSKIKEKWQAMAAQNKTWTFTKTSKVYPITKFSVILPFWNPDSSTGKINASTLTSIEVTGGTQTRNVPASTPLMTREQVVRNFGVGINLGGTLECTQYTHAKETDAFWRTTTNEYVTGPALWSSPAPIADLDYEVVWHNPRTTQAMLTAMKAAGFGAIRIPVSWGEHITYTGGQYAVDKAWMQRVHQVVDYAYDAGMYVILNTHHEQRWLERADLDTAYEEIRPVFTWLWHTIAEEFKDYDQRLVFEGMNEPRASGQGVTNAREWGWTEMRDAITLNKLNQLFVDTVRAASGPYNKVRVLSVQAHHCGATMATLSSIKVPDDPYVVVAVHLYRPGELYNADDPVALATFSDDLKFDIDAGFEGLQLLMNNSTYDVAGVPIYIGEYGFRDAGGNNTCREQAIRYYSTWAKEMGMPAFYWTGCDLFDRRTLTWSTVQGSEGRELIATWNDSSIVWGSRAKQYNSRFTKSLTSGTELSYVYSSGKQGENDTDKIAYITRDGTNQPCVNLTGYDVSDKDIAIHFSGYPPRIRMVDKTTWNGWIQVEPYLIVPDGTDLSGFTAIWTHEQLADKWAQAKASGAGSLTSTSVFNYFTVSTFGGSQNPDPYGPTIIGPPYLL